MSQSHLILSCSLDAGSRSALLAERLAELMRGHGHPVELLDFRRIELPFCDAGACYAHPEVQRLQGAVANAASVTIATPIYNYDVGGATRNLLALTGKAWTQKVVGFLCAAGGQGSYMAVMGLANSLMLDFRCHIVPRFVYATGADFDGDAVASESVLERLDQLGTELVRVAGALAS